jgi:ATP/maltotriose-dependent transcriptional regulator MalT
VAAEFGELALMKTPEDQVDGYIRRAIAAADDLVDSADGIRAKRVLDAACAIAQPGQLRAAVLRRIGFLTRDQAEARGLLDRALAEAEGDHASLASAHSALAILDLVVGDIPSAVEHSRRALSEAELTDDSSLQAEATAQVLMSRIMHGERISDALVARAIALDHDVDRAPMWGKPAAAVGYLALCRGDLVAARRFIESALTRSALKGDDLGRCEMLIFAVMLECRAGDFSTAAGYAREATEIAEENGLDHLMESVHFATSFAASHLGDVRLAREAGLKGFETANRLGHTGFMISGRCVIGFLELSLGDLAAAEDWLGPVPELMRDMGAIEPGIFRHAPDLIEAQVGLGYLDRAEEELSRLEAIAEELEHPWARAVALRSRALLCAARGDQAGADAAIEQGLRAHEAIPEPFELARMHLVAGTIHRRSKRKRAAREELELALTDFERMQTPLWADKARAELARVGRRAAEPQGLSPTEQRISELVASGRTNREIADELFLSLRTVEANLTRTYRKLGVRSRTELVRRRTESSG